MHAQSVLRNCTVSTKKKSLLARYFQLHSSTPYVLFAKLIDEYTNSFFLSGGGERGLTWRKIFIRCFEN